MSFMSHDRDADAVHEAFAWRIRDLYHVPNAWSGLRLEMTSTNKS
jgi:hypothetical protein